VIAAPWAGRQGISFAFLFHVQFSIEAKISTGIDWAIFSCSISNSTVNVAAMFDRV
jgi:inactivated superfamily I helicase